VIARPTLPVPVPDAVADLVGRLLPRPVRAAVAEAATCGRLLTSRIHAVCPLEVRMEAGGHLHQRLARANRVLAAHDPRLIHTWADLPNHR
jgi:hypothetical protein